MLLEISGEITPERMKGWSQSKKKKNTQLWMGLVIEARSNAVKSNIASVQFSSVTQSCPTLCDPMNRSTPGLPVHHQLPEFTQTHVHGVGDAIQPSHPLSSPSPPALNTSQHSRFLCNIALYSIGPCFYHQSHPQLGIVFALAPSLHSFWSYFSTDLQ